MLRGVTRGGNLNSASRMFSMSAFFNHEMGKKRAPKLYERAFPALDIAHCTLAFVLIYDGIHYR